MTNAVPEQSTDQIPEYIPMPPASPFEYTEQPPERQEIERKYENYLPIDVRELNGLTLGKDVRFIAQLPDGSGEYFEGGIMLSVLHTASNTLVVYEKRADQEENEYTETTKVFEPGELIRVQK